MKKNIIAPIIAGLLFLLFLSCSEDDTLPIESIPGAPGVVTATNITFGPTEISFFDQNDYDYNLSVSLGTVNKVDVISPSSTTSVTIEDYNSIYTSNFEKLNLSAIGDNADISLIPYIGEQRLDTVKTSIVVIHPISFAIPEDVVITDTEDQYVNYEITTKQNTVSTVMVESKVFETGTYATVSGDWDTKKDSISFNASNYSKLDTVYFRITATTQDGLIASKEEKVFIDTEYLGDASSILLSKTANEHNLQDPDNSSETEIKFSYTASNLSSLTIAAEVSDLAFVPYTAATDATFKFGDKLETIEVYNAGVSTASISGFTVNDLFAYKINRLENGLVVDYYGLLKIKSITILADGAYEVMIDVKEATNE